MRLAQCLLATAIALALPAGPARPFDPAVQFAVARSDPGLRGHVAAGDSLYIALTYRSLRPLRFAIEGRARGQRVTAGAMSNPSPTYPAGTGEALVWIAYRGDALLDEIKVIASDSNGRPVANLSEPAQLEWVAGLRSGPQGADWVRRLSDVQQDMLSSQMRRQQEQGGTAWDMLALFLLQAGLLAYVVLQPLTIWRFAGGWRIAAALPLAAMLPVVCHALYALNAGANLWPIALVFVMPLATVYLCGLIGMRLCLTARVLKAPAGARD